MTISTTASRISYNGNGATTAFSFPYRFLTNADLTVIKVAADGTETTLVLNTNYTVTGADDDAGGTVTVSVAPLSGQRLVIYRSVSITQEVDYITGDAFPAETHERALDRLTMVAQQHQDAIDRSAKLSETSTADADTLIANINSLAAIEDDVSTVAGISANVTTVAGIAANVTTVAGIAANVTTVAGIAANVTSVAGNATNINAVAANETNIDAVAANEVNIDAVAGNATNINTVAGVAANVTTVAGIAAAVTAVAADATDIGTVAADIADINTCADNMAAILDAPAQASAAAASAAAAAASLDNFDDRYLGSKATAPTVDNDGNPLVAGALYFNNGTIVTDDKGMWVYDGGTWIAASAASQAILVKYKYLATAGQTSFSGTDANGLTLSYTAGSIIVTLNGVVMDAADYTATTGSSVVLGTAAALNDELGVFAFSTFDIANTYTQAQVDAFAVKLTGDQTVAGVKTFSSAPVMGVTGLTGDIAAARITTALNASGSAPIYGARAWVNFNGNGTVAIRASGNVSSITDNGTGDYTVNFTTAMPDTNYSTCFGSSHTWNSTNGDQGWANLRSNNGGTSPQQTSGVRIWTSSKNSGLGGAVDNEQVNVSIHR